MHTTANLPHLKILTAIAFAIFKKHDVNIQVLEVV